MKLFAEIHNLQRIDVPEERMTMNPKLWTENNELYSEAHNALVDAADEFVELLGIDPKYIDDVRLVGGNASYNWNDASDLDATIMLNRDLDLKKEDIRRLQISANNLTYRVNPSLNGIDLNFYLSTRNVGGLRPARQSIYSLGERDFISGPTKYPEMESNFLAGKANYIAELIEECVDDDSNEADDCAEKLLQKLKRYRVKGLKRSEGEESTENMVWRILSRSGYIKLLKSKMEQLEKDYFRIKTPQALIRNEEFRMLVKEGAGMSTVPHSIVKWNKRILTGSDPTSLITRIKPLLALFVDEDGMSTYRSEVNPH